MTVSTALKKKKCTDTFCLKYYRYWVGGDGLPLANVLKEESVHWMIFVMLFMWSCCVNGVILCLLRPTDGQSDATLCESVVSYRCPSCALSNVSLFPFVIEPATSAPLLVWTHFQASRSTHRPDCKQWTGAEPGVVSFVLKSQRGDKSQSLSTLPWIRLLDCRSRPWWLAIRRFSQLQSDFKGDPGIPILITLQNNGRPLYLPKIQSQEGNDARILVWWALFHFVSPSLFSMKHCLQSKAFSFILFLDDKKRINCT